MENTIHPTAVLISQLYQNLQIIKFVHIANLMMQKAITLKIMTLIKKPSRMEDIFSDLAINLVHLVMEQEIVKRITLVHLRKSLVEITLAKFVMGIDFNCAATVKAQGKDN
jgi:hypothetical protein